jgi:hypothetical protein
MQSHVFLQLPTGSLRPGDHLMLQLSDDYGGNFRYTLSVVEPDKLPRPPFKVEADWQLGAWRIAAAPEESHLDAISRLQMAPPDSLGARRILEAVWTEVPF